MVPPPLPGLEEAAVEAACAVGLAGWRGEAHATVADLERYFAVNGYARASTVSDRGEFAIRGGVIDVFPPNAEEPVRLDLFGDTLESIRAFDPETQRSTKQLKDVALLPVSEALGMPWENPKAAASRKAAATDTNLPVFMRLPPKKGPAGGRPAGRVKTKKLRTRPARRPGRRGGSASRGSGCRWTG